MRCRTIALSCSFVLLAAGVARADGASAETRPLLGQAVDRLMSEKGGKIVKLGIELSKAGARVPSGNHAELGEPVLTTVDFNTVATVFAQQLRKHVAANGIGGLTAHALSSEGYEAKVIGVGSGKATLSVTAPDGTRANFEASVRGAEAPRRTWTTHVRVEGNRRIYLALSDRGHLTMTQEVASKRGVRVVERSFENGARTFTKVVHEQGALGQEARPETASWSQLAGQVPLKTRGMGSAFMMGPARLPGVRRDGVRVRAAR